MNHKSEPKCNYLSANFLKITKTEHSDHWLQLEQEAVPMVFYLPLGQNDGAAFFGKLCKFICANCINSCNYFVH